MLKLTPTNKLWYKNRGKALNENNSIYEGVGDDLREQRTVG